MFWKQSIGRRMTQHRASSGIRLTVALLAAVFATGAFAADDNEDKKKEEDTIEMPEVLVSKTADGSSEGGYRVETVKQVGPWGEMNQQDLPYSMTVLPADLIKNQSSVNNTQQIIRMIPGAYDGFTRSNYGIVGFSLRGFGATQLVDGVRLSSDSRGINFEDLEQIEIQPGFTGFMYGGGYAGGAVNMVLKRPTKEYFNNITVGNAGGQQYYVHGDLGGPIPGTNGKLGYRVNLVYDDGESARRYVSNKQTGVTAAIDWNATNKLKFQFDISRQSWEQIGEPGGSDWAAGGELLPDPPKATRSFGQPWALIDNKTFRYGANMSWNLTSFIDIRAAYRWQRNRNLYISGDGPHFPGDTQYIKTTPEPGINTYEVWSMRYDGGRNYHYGGNVYADFKFDTGILKHKLTAGWSTSIGEPHSLENYMEGGYYGVVTWDNPYLPEPEWGSPELLESWESGPWHYGPKGGRYGQAGRNEHSNYTIGDQINIGEDDRFTLLVGASRVRVYTKNLDWDTGEVTSRYDKPKWSPTVGLTYKPIKQVSLYGNWIQAQESGQTVGDYSEENGIRWVFRNAQEILLPTTSQQFEGGVKTTLNDNLLLSAAYFHINKANYFTERFPEDYTLKLTQDGRQVNKGLELSASGKVADRLTLWGGLTWMSARIRKTNNELQKDQTPANLPVFYTKLYGEFQLLPKARFYVTGGAYHTGSQRYGESVLETRELTSYTVYDLGARYETRATGLDTIFRLNIQNVTDARYWTRATSAHLADPRTLVFSVTTQF